MYNRQKKIASHNTMSYLPVKQWWMKPFGFMAQCQSKDIKSQFDNGIRYFDFRVRYNEKSYTYEFAHGMCSYKADVFYIMQQLNTYASITNESVHVRILLETSKADLIQEEMFKSLCETVSMQYSNLKFNCGRRKFDWKQLYNFDNPEPSLDQKISSMTWLKLDDWWPWLYAKLMNKKNIAEGTNKDYLMLDFV